MKKVRQWDRRKEKKARFKRSLKRAIRRGDYIYCGWAKFDIDGIEEWTITFRTRNDAKKFCRASSDTGLL